MPFFANSTCSVHDADRLLVERPELLVRQPETRAKTRDRIVLGRVVAVVLRPVHLRVADVVAVHAVRADVEEDGAVPVARVLECIECGLVHRLDVLAVDLPRPHVVGERALAHVVPHRRVLPAGRRLRPVVVLADEDGLRAPELRQVERLVEGADVGRPVAEERDGDPRLVTQPECEPRTRDGGQAAADHGVRAVVAALDVVEMHRAAVAVRAAFDLPVELRHHVVRVRPAGQGMTVRAMGRSEDVALLHRLAHPDRRRLLPDRHVQESRQLAGTEALLHPLLEAADEQHLPQELAQRLFAERALLLDLGHGSAVYVLGREPRR